MRFVLSSSGHIAGIVNPPSKKAKHWTNDLTPPDPDAWRADLAISPWVAHPATGTGPIDDDDRYAELFAKLLGDGPRERIHGPASGKGNNKSDGLVRPCLPHRRSGQPGQAATRCNNGKKAEHGCLPACLWYE